MNLFKDLTIRTKLLFFVVFFLFTLSLVSYLGISQMGNIHLELKRIVENDLPLLKVVEKIEKLQMEESHILEKAMRQFFTSKGRESHIRLKELAENFRSIDREADEAIKNGVGQINIFLDNPSLSWERLKIYSIAIQLKELARKHDNYEEKASQLLAFLQEGGDKEFISPLIEEIEAEEKSFHEASQNLSQEVESLTFETLSRADRHEKKGVNLIWTFSALAIFAGILAGLFFTRLISYPLHRLSKRVEEIEITRDFSLRAPVYGKDEIGLMAESLNHMLQTVRIDLEKINRAVEEGNLDIKLSSKGEKDLLASSINGLHRMLKGTVKQARKISEGEFSTILAPRSEKDQLVHSLAEMTETLRRVTETAEEVARGNFTTSIDIKGPNDRLGQALSEMTRALNRITRQNDRQKWIISGLNELNLQTQGIHHVEQLTSKITTFLAHYLEAAVAALYLYDEKKGTLTLSATFAITEVPEFLKELKIGERLSGQAASEKKALFLNFPQEENLRIGTATKDVSPRALMAVPLVFSDSLVGVMEFGALEEFRARAIELVQKGADNAAIAINSVQSREKLADLLEESQRMGEELQTQQEELRTTNEELEEKSESLEVQKKEIEEKNHELERTRRAIESKARELEETSRYKSEFLANMSHELRTPLNSLLLLSRTLIENRHGNLKEEDVQSAQVIHNSGQDLLNLINEILDLSKIEAGKMTVERQKVLVEDLKEKLFAQFSPLTKEKEITFEMTIDPQTPSALFTDGRRLEQILKNLLSNAIKFTQKGGITVAFNPLFKDLPLFKGHGTREEGVAIAIKDTGIGIAGEQQKKIFEAFQQADGGVSRKFGGTGLGLSISRELAALLGGEIHLTSDPGQGSTFTLCLPVRAERRKRTRPGPAKSRRKEGASTKKGLPSLSDDREILKKGEKSILIIEDDTPFAETLGNLCREKGFACLLASSGEEGIKLAARHVPTAIILDIHLPLMDGWAVLEHLKNTPGIRHIPVHMISSETATLEAVRRGAIGFLTKPVDREEIEGAINRIEEVVGKRVKDLLVVEDDDNLRKGIIGIIGNGDVHSHEARTGEEAIEKIQSQNFDCVVLDLGLPDMSGFELLKRLEQLGENAIPPVIIYTGRELTREEEQELRQYSETIIVKGVKSEERLLDETSLFLHRMVSRLPEKKRKMIINIYDKDQLFEGKKVLVVDDDMRSLFSLSKVLEEKGFVVTKAEDGKKALEKLKKEPKVDLILMDVMMPVMDGYQTMRKIRAQKRFNQVPVIALTAKAMKEDREKCLEAGANDYLPKPIDVDRLFSMLRVWLYQ